MKNIKKFNLISVIVALVLIGSFMGYQIVQAVGGQGTATIDASVPGGNVTITTATSHKFTVVLSIGASGITADAQNPTFTIPAGFTAPNATPVANAGLVNADGKWSVSAAGGTCTVDFPAVGLTAASGQIITVDVTTTCTVAVPDTITLTYQGQSASAMPATALVIKTADDIGWGVVTAIPASPTITVTGTSATLNVIKTVVNNNGGTAIASAWTLTVTSSNGGSGTGSAVGVVSPGTVYTLETGKAYSVAESSGPSEYSASLSSECTIASAVVSTAYTCTITNTYISPTVLHGGGGPIVPLIGILKIPTPLALPTGTGSVTYNYTVWNVGGQEALINILVTDDKCAPLILNSGDINSNNKLDSEEIWKYSCTTTLLKTTTNTAIATGYSDDVYHHSTIATAITTVVVGTELPAPLINIVKIPSRLTPFSFGGGDVVYTYTVKNPGVVAMHNVSVTDDKCSSVTLVSGDANNNNLLDINETFVYTCAMNIAVSTKNIATVKGTANGFTAVGYAFADVFVSEPNIAMASLIPIDFGGTVLPIAAFIPKFPDTGSPPNKENIPFDVAIPAGVLMLISASLVFILKIKKINN